MTAEDYALIRYTYDNRGRLAPLSDDTISADENKEKTGIPCSGTVFPFLCRKVVIQQYIFRIKRTGDYPAENPSTYFLINSRFAFFTESNTEVNPVILREPN